MAKVDLGCSSIDLKKLFNGGHRYRAIEGKKFTETVTFSLPHSPAIGRVFRTGKLNVMGAKSDKEVLVAARQLTRIIQKSGFPVNSLIIAVIICSYFIIHHNSLLYNRRPGYESSKSLTFRPTWTSNSRFNWHP